MEDCMMKRIVTVALALVFVAYLSLAAEPAKVEKSVASAPQFEYPIYGEKIKLGMNKSAISQMFKEVKADNPSEPSEKEYVILADMDKRFYFKNDKLTMMKFSYRNESILQIPDKKLGKGKVIKEEPNRVTQWKKGSVTITRTDFPLDGGEDSESEVVIK
jgi:hypothetical protein